MSSPVSNPPTPGKLTKWILTMNNIYIFCPAPQPPNEESFPFTLTSCKPPLYVNYCHGTTSLLSFLVFVCSLPHLRHLPPPSDLVCLPSAASTPTPRCTHATMLHLRSD